MTFSRNCHRNWLFLLLMIAPFASAHEVEVCLAKLAQSSERLQTCRVAQSAPGQCDVTGQQLDRFIAECQAAQHPREAIQQAIAHGIEHVMGRPEDSPYQKQLARQQWEASQMGPNIERFKSQFPDYEQFVPMLMEHFTTADCPNGYTGYADRWIFVGAATLYRYDLTEGDQQPPQARNKYLFAKEDPGKCYPVVASGDSQFVGILNVPEGMLQLLEKRGELVRCADSACATDRAALEDHFAHYQSAFRQYRQLMMCADIEKRNDGRKTIKGTPRSETNLPDFCPKKEVYVTYLNSKGLVEQLDQQLFLPTPLTVGPAKTPTN